MKGEIIDNYNTATLVNNTQKTETIIVPDGHRWKLFGGCVLNADSVSRTVTVKVFNSSDKLIGYFVSASVNAAGYAAYPCTQASKVHCSTSGFPMKAGDYIQIVWAAGGASAGGTAEYSAVITEAPE